MQVEDLPCVNFKLTSCEPLEDQDFGVMDWLATFEIDCMVEELNGELDSKLIEMYGQVHEALYTDRTLGLPNGCGYITTQGINSVEMDDESSSVLSKLSTTWTIQFRTVNVDLTN